MSLKQPKYYFMSKKEIKQSVYFLFTGSPVCFDPRSATLDFNCGAAQSQLFT